MQEQEKEVDSSELSERRDALQPDKIQVATSKIKTAYGEKFDSLILFDSKRDVAKLLGKKTEVRPVRKQLQKKQEQNVAHKRTARKHEQER